LPGTVFISGEGSDIHEDVGTDGYFVAGVAPGTYLVSGRSPLYGSGQHDCVASRSPVSVEARQTVTVTVSCEEK
jgi:hypothetical protein